MTAFRRQIDEHHPLIPGYTGYIPLRFYRIGTSFGRDSVHCVNEFRDASDRKELQTCELHHSTATAPQLPPIRANEEMIDILDDYNYKRHPYVLGPVETRRGFFEPPIPGWTGFVPRSRVTEYGHGARYHVVAENCYQDFKNMLEKGSHGPAGMDTKGEQHITQTSKLSRPQQRFYRPEGMLPKYTGHIPHERSGIGRTFGNISRSCSVCKHMDENYGAYLAKKRKAEQALEQMLNEKKAADEQCP